MTTRQEIEERRGNLEAQAEEARRIMETEAAALGQLLYDGLREKTPEEMEKLSAQEIADALSLDGAVSHIKRMKETEVSVAEWEEEIGSLSGIVFCPKCENSIDGDDLFCPVCGTRIVKQNADNDGTTCPQCGHPRKDDARFCVHCGFSFDQETEPESAPAPVLPRFCFKCGEPLESDAKFCFKCGAKQED